MFLQPLLTASYKGAETMALAAQRGCGLPIPGVFKTRLEGLGVPWSSMEGVPVQGRGWNEISVKVSSKSKLFYDSMILSFFPCSGK